VSDPPVTVEAISRSYEPFSILVRRWAACWVDFLVLAGMLLLADLALGNALYRKTIWLWLGVLIAYYPVLEGCGGLTLGKLLLRIRVVDAGGRAPEGPAENGAAHRGNEPDPLRGPSSGHRAADLEEEPADRGHALRDVRHQEEGPASTRSAAHGRRDDESCGPGIEAGERDERIE